MRRHIANHLLSLPASSLLLVASAVAVLLVPAVASGSGGAAKAGQQLTLFSRVTQEQFLNHVDDRQRGYGSNLFGNFKAPTATTKESSGGPFPGDQALFHFNLYSGADLKKLAGTADFTCSYSFKRNGFCDAVYQLSDGRSSRRARSTSSAKTFSLVISGGTGKYRSLTGQVVSTPAARLSQRLAIALSPTATARPAADPQPCVGSHIGAIPQSRRRPAARLRQQPVRQLLRGKEDDEGARATVPSPATRPCRVQRLFGRTI